MEPIHEALAPSAPHVTPPHTSLSPPRTPPPLRPLETHAGGTTPRAWNFAGGAYTSEALMLLSARRRAGRSPARQSEARCAVPQEAPRRRGHAARRAPRPGRAATASPPPVRGRRRARARELRAHARSPIPPCPPGLSDRLIKITHGAQPMPGTGFGVARQKKEERNRCPPLFSHLGLGPKYCRGADLVAHGHAGRWPTAWPRATSNGARRSVTQPHTVRREARALSRLRNGVREKKHASWRGDVLYRSEVQRRPNLVEPTTWDLCRAAPRRALSGYGPGMVDRNRVEHPQQVAPKVPRPGLA